MNDNDFQDLKAGFQEALDLLNGHPHPNTEIHTIYLDNKKHGHQKAVKKVIK